MKKSSVQSSLFLYKSSYSKISLNICQDILFTDILIKYKTIYIILLFSPMDESSLFLLSSSLGVFHRTDRTPWPGVCIIKINDIFASPPLFQNYIFFPKYTENVLFFHLLPPLYSRFYLINHHIFSPTKKYKNIKNIHPCLGQPLLRSQMEFLVISLNNRWIMFPFEEYQVWGKSIKWGRVSSGEEY